MPLTTYQAKDGLLTVRDIGSRDMRNFYDLHGWIAIRGMFGPADYRHVHAYINHLIDLKLAELGLAPSAPSPIVKTADYLRICQVERSKGGEIYRACRQLLPLHQMATSAQVIALAKFLMKTEFINSNPFTAIRIDQRTEEKYLFEWHQDYPYAQGSQDGIVIWGSLLDCKEGDGGIKLLPGSHRSGLRKVELPDPLNISKNGAHSIRLRDLDKYDDEDAIRVDLDAGDVLVFSTLLVHKSIPMERGDVRWAFQIRHGNFSNSDAARRGWPGGSALGDRFEVSHPEYVAEPAPTDAA